MNRCFKAAYFAAGLSTFSGLALATPTLVSPLPDIEIGHTATPTKINLSGRFSETGTNVIRMVTNFGNIDIAMFDQAKPLTCTNFRNYVSSGRYINSIFHRSAEYSAGVPFVLQAGGYKRPSVNNAAPQRISTFATVVNEPGISNLRGTLAMAKIGEQPDRATSQWFINLTDRNATDPTGARLDTQNGGFTVFARVIAGMNIVDQIVAVERIDAAEFYEDGSLGELPLIAAQFDPQPIVKPTDFVTITSMFAISGYPTLSYTAASDHPEVVDASVTGTQLTLVTKPSQTGSAVITVTAKSPDTSFVVDSFVVKLRCSPCDIANDQGTPGGGTPDLPNSGVNEGDYNAFFAGYFDAAPYCDIADDAGNPLPAPPGISNSGVNEGDYNCFFQFFFDGC